MSEERSDIVKRVVRSLEDTRDPDTLMWAYFEADREALIQATRETLEATREEEPAGKIEETLEHELIEALRYPADRRGGVLARLWIHRTAVTTTLGLLALAAWLVVALA